MDSSSNLYATATFWHFVAVVGESQRYLPPLPLRIITLVIFFPIFPERAEGSASFPLPRQAEYWSCNEIYTEMRQLSPLRPDLHLLISRLTVLKQYIVLHPEKGSIAETMVIPLLNSIDFTIFLQSKVVGIYPGRAS